MINILNLDENLNILNESFPKIFNVLNSMERTYLVQDLTSKGFDLQKLPEPVEVTVKGEAMLTKMFKDPKTILVFCDENKTAKSVTVTAGGAILVYKGISVYETSINVLKKVIANAKNIYAFQVKNVDVTDLQQKQAVRQQVKAQTNATDIKTRLAEKRVNEFDSYMKKVSVFVGNVLTVLSNQDKDYRILNQFIDSAKKMYKQYKAKPADTYSYEMLVKSLIYLDDHMTDLTKKYKL